MLVIFILVIHCMLVFPILYVAPRWCLVVRRVFIVFVACQMLFYFPKEAHWTVGLFPCGGFGGEVGPQAGVFSS